MRILDNMGRYVAGDVGSLAWAFTDYDNSPTNALKALTDLLAGVQSDDGDGAATVLRKELQGLGGIIQDWGLNPEGPFPTYAALLAEGSRRQADAQEKGWKDLIDTLRERGQDEIADQAEAARIFEEELRAQGDALGFHPQGEWQTAVGALMGALRGLLAKVPATLRGSSTAPLMGGAAGGLSALLPNLAGLSAFMVAAETVNPGALEGAAGGVLAKFQTLFERMQQAMVHVLTEGDLNDPATAQPRAARALELAVSFGTLAHLAAVAMEKFAPGKEMGVNQIAGFLADMGSFQPISRAVWQHLIDASVGRPLEQHYNLQFPTRQPPFGEIFAMARKHEYDADPLNADRIPEGFIRDMGRHGIPYYWVKRFWRFFWADPSLMQLIRMADIALPWGQAPASAQAELAHYALDPQDPAWWLKLKLKKAGHDFIDVDQLVQTIVLRVSANERTRLSTQLRNAWREGRISQPEFVATWWAVNHPGQAASYPDAFLEGGPGDVAGYLDGSRPDVLDLAYSVIEVHMQRADDQVAALTKLYTEQLHAGVLDPGDYAAHVRSLYDDAGPANNTILLELAKREKKALTAQERARQRDFAAVARELQAGYVAQFKAGAISREQLAANLEAIGLPEELAQAVAGRAAAQLFKPAKPSKDVGRALDLQEHAYLDLYDGGLITEAQLAADLQALGRSQPYAAAAVARAGARLAKRLANQAAQAKGAAAKAQEREKERAAREEASDAEQAAARLRTRLEAYLREAVKQALITGPQYLQGLLDAGYPEPEARAILARDALRFQASE